jgi:hypothetical protein
MLRFMNPITPRRICDHCGRSIAVVGGRFARHDPRDRGPLLLSCPGSLQAALRLEDPDPVGTASLFELVARQEPAATPSDTQDALFEASPAAA